MKTVNTHEAKTHLSRILSDVERGEEYVFARAGRAIARLVPYSPPPSDRRPGKWRGMITVHDDFDAEDPELERLFEESGL